MSNGNDSICVRRGTRDVPALVQAGTYRLSYVEHRTVLAFGRQPKVEVLFCVMDGAAMGEHLRRFYRVKDLTSKPKRNGTFKAGWHCELLHEFVMLFNERPERLDRIPMSRFSNRIITGHVRTVNRNSQQQPLPELLQYSVIERLVGLEQ